MSNVVVYVFLLDNLAGFQNALNESVIKNTPVYRNITPILQQCDSKTTNQILSAVAKELDNEIMPTMRTGDNFAQINDALTNASQDALYNALLESSVPAVGDKDESYSKLVESFENDSSQKYRRTFSFENEENIRNAIADHESHAKLTNVTEKEELKKGNLTNFGEIVQNTNQSVEESKCNETIHNTSIITATPLKEDTNNITEAVTNTTKMVEVNFPKSAPFLVAIFETLSNITAQTCAGTLIAPNWVLTGANCVNILNNLYANDTNMTDYETMYTVVAGAIDPLSDGSAHNVTAVLQHEDTPGNSTRNRKSIHLEVGAFLAMMQIDPPFEGAGLPIVEEKVKKGDVMIYGWILTKNDSGLDTLHLVVMSALILSTAECQAMYTFNNNDVICIYNNDNDTNITQLSSGGPVLIIQDGEVKLLAVAQTDEHVFIAYPLYEHYRWIYSVLNTYK